MRTRKQAHYAQLSKQEKETLFNFFKPLTHNIMSIWDTMPKASADKDYSNSRFLDKRLITSKTMTLTFTGVLEKEQRPETPEEYKTPTGRTWMFYFQDEKGVEFELEQKNENGKFYIEIEKLHVEPGERVTITREGEGVKTLWTIVRVNAPTLNTVNTVFTPPVPPLLQPTVADVPTKEIPF